MSTTEARTDAGAKKSIEALRERRGPLSDAFKVRLKEQARLKKAIADALKRGAKTIPQLAQEIGVESARIVWQLMALKKYGTVVEGEPAGDYYTYALKEDDR